ncbi:eag, partial [Symbiodinium sp. CCMP2456]
VPAPVIDPSTLETQLQMFDSPEKIAPSNNNRQADKAMRPPIQAVKPQLPDDVLPGIKAQIDENLKEPMDVVEAQKQ